MLTQMQCKQLPVLSFYLKLNFPHRGALRVFALWSTFCRHAMLNHKNNVKNSTGLIYHSNPRTMICSAMTFMSMMMITEQTIVLGLDYRQGLRTFLGKHSLLFASFSLFCLTRWSMIAAILKYKQQEAKGCLTSNYRKLMRTLLNPCGKNLFIDKNMFLLTKVSHPDTTLAIASWKSFRIRSPAITFFICYEIK